MKRCYYLWFEACSHTLSVILWKYKVPSANWCSLKTVWNKTQSNAESFTRDVLFSKWEKVWGFLNQNKFLVVFFFFTNILLFWLLYLFLLQVSVVLQGQDDHRGEEEDQLPEWTQWVKRVQKKKTFFNCMFVYLFVNSVDKKITNLSWKTVLHLKHNYLKKASHHR